MGAFSADWLALREPADFAARAARLPDALVGSLLRHDVVSALDVACGTGSNVRYLAERLPVRQDWLLVDVDQALLAQMSACMRQWADARGYQIGVEGDRVVLRGDRLWCRIGTRRADLVDLTDATIFDGRRLVTASAMLDLVSEGWLRQLTQCCRERNATALFALNYDGRIICSPEEPEDELVRHLVNQHQRIDKGFGPALGPDASEAAERLLAGAGYQVQRQPSDWVLSPDARGLQRALVEGWAHAAAELAPKQSASIGRWKSRRLSHIRRGESRFTVGHQDVAAW